MGNANIIKWMKYSNIDSGTILLQSAMNNIDCIICMKLSRNILNMGTLGKRRQSFCPFIWVALEQELCLPSIHPCLPSISGWPWLGWACRASTIIGLPRIRRLSRKRVSPLVISRLKLKPYFQGAIRTLPSIKLQVNDFGGCKDKVKLPLS